jgi:hypothetical protein
MALGMRHWLMAAVGACGLVAAAKLPPDPFTYGRAEVPDRRLPEEVRFTALARDVSRSRSEVRRMRWSDSLSARLARDTESGAAAGYLGPDGSQPEAEIEAFQRRFDAEVAAVPNRRADVLVGTYVVDGWLGDPLGDRRAREIFGSPGTFGEEYYLGERDGRAYCFSADVNRSWSGTEVRYAFGQYEAFDRLRYNYLGACRWAAEFGAPGPAVRAWLKAGGIALSFEPSIDRWVPAWWWRGGLSPARRRGLFGLSGLWGSPTTDACLAGRGERCAEMFSRPLARFDLNDFGENPVQEGAFLGASAPWQYRDALWVWRWFLADLYAEFGPDRTRAFWTSPSPDLLTAFRDAFGMEAGVWVSKWVRSNAGYVPPGPLPRVWTLAWALSVLVACAGIAMLVNRRRTVA